LAADAKAPNGARVVFIREGGSEFPVMISRGPKFAATYGQVPPLLFFATGAGCAVLLAFLVLQAMRASQLRAELEAERMRGRLVQSFSHEFRTPLSVILSSADLLEAGGTQLDTTRRAEVIAQIQDSTLRLSEMAEEILLLSRLESQRTQPKSASVELHALCESLVRDTNTTTRNHCRIEINANGTATLDSAILRPALANLLSNAVKYSPPGEVVRLAVEHRGNALIFTVRDNGIGIPDADLARIGEPFHRATNVGDTPGTGLGLAIVYRSVALLGGTIAIESKEGHGTTATLTISIA
jgi:signal transduction histidine kinase